MTKINTSDKERFVELWEKSVPNYKMALEFGVNLSTIYNASKRFGLKARKSKTGGRPRRVPDDIAFKSMWDSGVPPKQIAEYYNVSRPAVYRAAKRFGYANRPISDGEDS